MEHISELNYAGIIAHREDLEDYLSAFISAGGRLCKKDEEATFNVFRQLKKAA